eukprot:TCALIF_03975-PA protein Name:"Protein of unknown function" AED:0.46 eAED:0.46 QI:70/0/0/0.25/0.66/0.5/4/0/186
MDSPTSCSFRAKRALSCGSWATGCSLLMTSYHESLTISNSAVMAEICFVAAINVGNSIPNPITGGLRDIVEVLHGDPSADLKEQTQSPESSTTVIMKSIAGFGSLLLIAVLINVAQCRQFRRSSLLDEESINRDGLPSYEATMKPLLEKCRTDQSQWECQLFQLTDDHELTIPPYYLLSYKKKVVD